VLNVNLSPSSHRGHVLIISAACVITKSVLVRAESDCCDLVGESPELFAIYFNSHRSDYNLIVSQSRNVAVDVCCYLS